MPPRRDAWAVDHHRRSLVRALVLERDGHRCQIRGPECLGVADTVDHIVPRALGGPLYDPANLRAACHVCNASRRLVRFRARSSRDW